MRFHCPGLAHTVTSHEYNACAFTQKVLKLCAGLHAAGHEVIHYGHEESEVQCSEHVTVSYNRDLKAAYGSYNWRKEFFRHDTADVAYRNFADRCNAELRLRKQPGDFLLIPFGWGHKTICEANQDVHVVESGIGYPWVLSRELARWKVFESYAVRNAVHGSSRVERANNDDYEVVIPNYFDPDDFGPITPGKDYLLYLGRITRAKGVHIVAEAAHRAGMRLKIAGQGDLAKEYDGPTEHIELIGYADVETRRELMRNAHALVIASQYIEPFGGVAVEAMMSGTPIITSDTGAFTEYNVQGRTGYRCRTLGQYVWAIKNVQLLDRVRIRRYAIDNFSTQNVVQKYEEFFQLIEDTRVGRGWYENWNRDFVWLGEMDYSALYAES
jgi:glycosyltransferase involved in cell wall biosynthesis